MVVVSLRYVISSVFQLLSSICHCDADSRAFDLNKAKKDTDSSESVICVHGKIDGIECLVGVMDSFFMMGSMGSLCGERITRLIELAKEKKLPLILFTTSGGARMQEGVISLFQMAKTSAALASFKETGLYISVLTDPTTGGVSASFASLADITIAKPINA